MIRSNDFFPETSGLTVSEQDYELLSSYEPFLDTFARTTSKTIYVIDYYRKNFFYVSDNALFLFGRSAAEIKKMGFGFYIHQVPRSDLSLFLEINEAGFSFARTVAPEHLPEYTLSYDFHIRHLSGQVLPVNQKQTPLRLTREGKVWLVFCTVSFSSHIRASNPQITRKGCNLRWTYHAESKKWVESKKAELKEAEKNVLRLSAQGYTMDQIAKRLYKSVDTIKSYKRKLFEKLEVNNIAEAISYAINNNLI